MAKWKRGDKSLYRLWRPSLVTKSHNPVDEPVRRLEAYPGSALPSLPHSEVGHGLVCLATHVPGPRPTYAYGCYLLHSSQMSLAVPNRLDRQFFTPKSRPLSIRQSEGPSGCGQNASLSNERIAGKLCTSDATGTSMPQQLSQRRSLCKGGKEDRSGLSQGLREWQAH